MHRIQLGSPDNALAIIDLPGPGPAAVLLHGLGCTASHDFPRIVADPAMPARRYLLVDLPGAGHSGRPADFDHGMRSQAAVVLQALTTLGIDRFDLFGHSMGGSVAIELAHAWPDRVRSLVVAEPNLDAGGGVGSRAIAAFTPEDYVHHGHADTIAAAAQQGNRAWAAGMATWDALAVHRAATALVRGGTQSWRQQLLSMTLPRTWLVGERSLPDVDLQRLPAQGVAAAVVPAAGHSMMWDNPAGLAATIAAAWHR